MFPKLRGLERKSERDGGEGEAPLSQRGRVWSGRGCAVAGKGLILPSGGNHVVFLELRRHSRVTTGISAFPLYNTT